MTRFAKWGTWLIWFNSLKVVILFIDLMHWLQRSCSDMDSKNMGHFQPCWSAFPNLLSFIGKKKSISYNTWVLILFHFHFHFGHEKKNGRSSVSRQVMLVFFLFRHNCICSNRLDRQILNIQSFIQYSKESLFQKFVLKVVTDFHVVC